MTERNQWKFADLQALDFKRHIKNVHKSGLNTEARKINKLMYIFF